MLLRSLKARCKAPGVVGSIGKYLESLTRANRVYGSFGYDYWTELHFANGAESAAHFHHLWACVCAFGLEFLVVMPMVMAMVMVLVIVIIVSEALRQAGWLCQHLC